jgi:YggT family protein
MSNALIFIVETLFDVVCFLFLARLILQASKADFYNPISQGVVRITDPVLVPLRILVPRFRNIDFAAFVAALLVKLIATAIVSGLSTGYMQPFGTLFVFSFIDVLRLILTFYLFGILLVVVLSFLNPGGGYHPAIALLGQVMEPVMAPARRVIPPFGGLDLSPILTLMVIELLRDYVLPALLATLLR